MLRGRDALRPHGQREAQEAYAFDGLVGLATAGGTQAPKTEIRKRVDLRLSRRLPD